MPKQDKPKTHWNVDFGPFQKYVTLKKLSISFLSLLIIKEQNNINYLGKILKMFIAQRIHSTQVMMITFVVSIVWYERHLT